MAIIFLVFSFAAIIIGFIMEGGHVASLLGVTSLIIVLGGTIGATALSTPVDLLGKAGKAFIIALFKGKKKLLPTIQQIYEISDGARKEGLLSLEKRMGDANVGAFLKMGMTLAVDGASNERIKDFLELEIEQMSQRHKDVLKIYELAGGYAPTMGILGTVMGLVHVLGNLAEPETLGGSIAAAFLATLYGIGTANLIFLPIANKLKALNEREINERLMETEGILSIALGENPKQIVEKLKLFLPKSEHAEFNKLYASNN